MAEKGKGVNMAPLETSQIDGHKKTSEVANSRLIFVRRVLYYLECYAEQYKQC